MRLVYGDGILLGKGVPCPAYSQHSGCFLISQACVTLPQNLSWRESFCGCPCVETQKGARVPGQFCCWQNGVSITLSLAHLCLFLYPISLPHLCPMSLSYLSVLSLSRYLCPMSVLPLCPMSLSYFCPIISLSHLSVLSLSHYCSISCLCPMSLSNYLSVSCFYPFSLFHVSVLSLCPIISLSHVSVLSVPLFLCPISLSVLAHFPHRSTSVSSHKLQSCVFSFFFSYFSFCLNFLISVVSDEIHTSYLVPMFEVCLRHHDQ